MNWKEHLRQGEQDELRRAEAAREAAREVYNATVRKLKSRCEARMRRAKDEG
tara:strand:- start:433 stop:588 length:156 start_codon:yes stop_codon:yes gene_type:complete